MVDHWDYLDKKHAIEKRKKRINVYNEGREAFHNKKCIWDCPYRLYSIDKEYNQLWKNGFMDAKNNITYKEYEYV